MPTYAIGDVQGCYDPLIKLLDIIQFDPSQDQLWFVGDLVNRGPSSLKTLRFIRTLQGTAASVLGNHDLTLLAVARNALTLNSKIHTFSDILAAEDREDLICWLEQRPLVHYDPQLNYVMVHAGIYPQWNLEQALTLSREVESVLRNSPENARILYQTMYDDTPNRWQPDLQGNDRLRFILNAFTRMRFCTKDGHLDLHTTTSIANAASHLYPWFNAPNRTSYDCNIIFGHWASLLGHCNTPCVFALDTGCVWGNTLTALRLEDQQRFSVKCCTP